MPRGEADGRSLDELWRAYKGTGDMAAREELILAYSHLVKYVAGRLAIGLPAHVEMDDLLSYGVFGLIDAVEKFNPDRGIKFETYAVTRVRGAILDGLRAMDWVPASLRQKARQVERAYQEVEARLGRTAADAEIAEFLGLDEPELQRLIRDLSYTALLSLEELWFSGDGGDGEFVLKDVIGDKNAEDPFASARLSEIKRLLGEAIERLPEKERIVVTLYYYEGLTAQEIARVLNLSVSRISQLHSKAILRLRGRLGRIKQALL